MTKKSSTKQANVKQKKRKGEPDNIPVEEVISEEKQVEEKPAEEAVGEKEEEKEKDSQEIIQELNDKYLRLSAEFDNYRKRTLREKMDLTKLASEEILLNLLPVLDDFERALQNMNEVTDCNAMKEGIDLIHGKFKDFLS
jgi:molecular chaperone GrpE